MVDFFNNPIAEFNELRIAFTNLVTTKAAEYSETVLTFVSNHSSELLYGSLSVFVIVTFMYLLGKLVKASYERDMYKRKSEGALHCETFWRNAYIEEYEKTEGLESEVEALNRELALYNEAIDKSSKIIVALEEERDELVSDRDSYQDSASYWEERCDEARTERDDFESDRDSWEERYDNSQAEICELEDKIELLQRMTDTYKELVDELETPQLRLAA